MEDFVYIILVIAWLAISLLRRKPKNETPGRTHQAPRPETTSMPKEVAIEDMFKELFGQKNENQPQPEIMREPTALESSFEEQNQEYSSFDDDFTRQPEPVFNEYASLERIDETYQFSTEVRDQTIDELLRANAAEDARKQAEDELLEVNADGLDMPEFDPRSAVIFSEIINRKYS